MPADKPRQRDRRRPTPTTSWLLGNTRKPAHHKNAARAAAGPGLDPQFADVRAWANHYAFDSLKIVPPPCSGWVNLAEVAE